MGIDMDELDAEFLRPQAALGALGAGVDTVGRLWIARPEYDHFAFLETVLDQPVAARKAYTHAVAIVMLGAPVPSFPGIRIRMHAGEADEIAEAQHGAQVDRKSVA